MTTRPVVCLLALSRIPDDPRVRRQGDAFHQAGWTVRAVGLPGAVSPAPEWVQDADQAVAEPSPPAVQPSAAPTARRRLRNRLRGFLESRAPFALPIVRPLLRIIIAVASSIVRIAARGRLALRLLAAHVSRPVAMGVYWSWSNIQGQYQAARAARADLWIANDWPMLPIAVRLAEELGGAVVYDTHEFAVAEYPESWRWRMFKLPIVRAVEQACIRRAGLVSTVSAGIAERLQEIYRLERPPMVIRNAPRYQAVPFRPTGAAIAVLYHGILAPTRGLELVIDSVPRWRPEFTMTIRGPGDPGYIAALRERIRQRGVAERVFIVPPVPMTALVAEAAAFDVGLFALQGHSEHNRYASPNKFFEYVMAGLALCVSDLPEMARLTRDHQLGVLIGGFRAEAIADAINQLDHAAIDRYRQNALLAARSLCWEIEAERFVTACRGLVSGGRVDR